jgi:hypothetical protein
MAGRRRKWRAPNDPTLAARQVWATVFPGEPWPKGWRVSWAGFMRGCDGLTLWRERRIVLSYADHAGRVITRSGRRKAGAVETLLHEFVHVRSPRLRHGVEFKRLANGLRRRLGFEEGENP